MTNLITTNCESCIEVEGEFDLSAAAAVLATAGAQRVDAAKAITKTGTGAYLVRLGPSMMANRVYDVRGRSAQLTGTAPAGAFGARVGTVTMDAAPNQDDILIQVITTNAAGAAADTSAAATVSFRVKFRYRPLP